MSVNQYSTMVVQMWQTTGGKKHLVSSHFHPHNIWHLWLQRPNVFYKLSKPTVIKADFSFYLPTQYEKCESQQTSTNSAPIKWSPWLWHLKHLQKVAGCWWMLSHLSITLCSHGIIHNSFLDFQSHTKCITKFTFFHFKNTSKLQPQSKPLVTYQQNKH